MPSKPILIMAGGTGGHVYPALAVADYLRGKGIPLFWLGTKRGLEARVVPARGYQLLTINIGGLRGKGLLKWILSPIILLIALLQSLLILVRIRPGAVLGMGGFASGPGGVAAWLMRIPLCVHEQNAIAGLTNRILARLADTVMQAFPGAFPDHVKVHTTGNPVRLEIGKVPMPDGRIHISNTEPMRLLVIGGSQGARRLNQIVPEALAGLSTETHLEVRHQTGGAFYAETAAHYRALNLNGRLEPYIEDMAEAYGWADLVVCRAGALTIAELAAAGAASILVPYPYAVDDHQTANAHHLVDNGAALLLPEPDLTRDNLGRLLRELYESRTRLLLMAQHARARAKPQATAEVAEACLEAAYAG
jgi:UDP-N-acetylglucosamine--N-acetylmuramyl-(pentapeptide) pyrophosphoryl-undecaprenol N-acetylglucosamine transferase